MANWLINRLGNCKFDVFEDDTELDRILETTKFDEFELVDSPLKQPGMSSRELLGVVACMSGLAPRKGSNGDLRTVVDPCRSLSLSFPNRVKNLCTSAFWEVEDHLSLL